MSAIESIVQPLPVARLRRGRRAQSDTRLLTASHGILFALIALAAIGRFWGLGQSYWYDETVTVSHLHLSFGAMLAQIPHTETTPPFYFIVAWCWAHAFGTGEVALRSLSAVAGILTVPVVFAAGEKLVSARTGLVVAALAAFNPLLVWYSQEARSYSLLVLLVSLSLLGFVHLRAEPTARWAIVWAIAAGLALWTHYYASLAIVPQAVFLLTRHRFRRPILVSGAIVAAVGLASVPFALHQLRFVAGSTWINASPLSGRALGVLAQFTIGYGGTSIAGLFGIAAWAGAWIAIWLLLFRGTAHERSQARVVTGLILLGCAMEVGLIVLGYDQMNTRNVIALWLPAAMLLAIGCGIRRAGALGAIATGLLCAGGISAIIGMATHWQEQRPDWRSVGKVLTSEAGGRSKAIFLINGCNAQPLATYLSGLRGVEDSSAVTEVDVVSLGHYTGWYASCMPESYVPLPRRLGTFTRSGPVITVNQFLIERLKSIRPTAVDRVFSRVVMHLPGKAQDVFASGGAKGFVVIRAGQSVRTGRTA